MDGDINQALGNTAVDPQVADALENAHGTAPQGNVADSLLKAARSWWQSGESWADRLHAYDEKIARGEKVPFEEFEQLFGGFAFPGVVKFPKGTPLGKSFSEPTWRKWDKLSPEERAAYEKYIEDRDNQITNMLMNLKAPPKE